ncbi:hypothetical protein FBT96_07370 [Rhodobacter capsulatus]|uniref:Uncharacterized protein n=1 Tax=Rhodobacter capsulatus TaxID=1061 RepID=A0A4U1JTX8_RHOCA|nr:hypothetical protein FBT96_07370 [Rhodobacter capsulatus]
MGVDLDYTEISSSGNMILLVASGTAVRIGDGCSHRVTGN